VGYAGGSKQNPTYVNIGDHTEVLQVEYDPQQTSFENLLELFWNNHDPTKLKISKSDGTPTPHTQYLSTLFYHDGDQKRLAEESLQRALRQLGPAVYTELKPFTKFYLAEDYHQKYLLQKHGALLSQLDISPGDELIASHMACRLNGYLGGYGSVEAFKKEAGLLQIDGETRQQILRKVEKILGQPAACGGS